MLLKQFMNVRASQTRDTAAVQMGRLLTEENLGNSLSQENNKTI
jgi:hypothetical protein